MSTTPRPSRKLPTTVPSATDPGLADTLAGDLIRAAAASASARQHLTSEADQLTAARDVVATGNYRQLDHNGNPLDQKAERLRVTSLVGILEARVADAQAALDVAEAQEEALDGQQP
ncbi:hypothetical protein F1C58_16080 (plasmid) [Glaciihabitans sp. INWT7]|uniref:hypothetical protein n=1 Tax=Glaciihabitans sp. INWT7 TaxID=2596912 RepID=UPI001625BEF9|nr:hypothetical protein [Glaciihabitans sp. INWT7]QNE48579.1 hypothetical protein F1C58_16080 [Glaciihabitans sp. INWT7]